MLWCIFLFISGIIDMRAVYLLRWLCYSRSKRNGRGRTNREMTINEMQEGSSVTLTVNLGSEDIIFETSVIQGFNEPYKKAFSIAAEPIMKDGKIVSLGRHRISASVINLADNREYIYTIAFNGMSKDKSHLLLFSPDDATAVNHRESYRVSCSYETVAQIGNNRKTVKGFLHDISFSGLGMVFSKEDFTNLSIGAEVSASIYDYNERMYKVTGHLVRFVEDFDENKTLIGVKFIETPMAVAGLVAALQQKELRVRKRLEEKGAKT